MSNVNFQFAKGVDIAVLKGQLRRTFREAISDCEHYYVFQPHCLL